jgi:hypothetical protein
MQKNYRRWQDSSQRTFHKQSSGCGTARLGQECQLRRFLIKKND